MKKLAITLFFLSMAANAYKPTVESLFRNGSNGEIGQNTVLANFILKKKLSQAELENQTIKEIPMVFSYKMLFSNEKENAKLVQTSYLGEGSHERDLIEADYFPVLNYTALRLGEEDVEKKFFYSLMASLVNNQGRLMIQFLNDIGVPALTNQESVDKEQLYFLGQYVAYLKSLEKEEGAEAENPLEPTDPEAAQKIKEVFKRPFLTPSPYVKRTKEGSDFFWVIKAENVFAKFSHDDHKLLEMSVKTPNGMIEVKCFNYILYGQEMQFPELVLLKDLNGDEHMLNMKKISSFSDSQERFLNRYGDYKKVLQESPDKEPIIKPPFIL